MRSHLPGWWGVTDNVFGGSAACPARQDCGLTRDCKWQCVRRLTTKELVFERFVTPQLVAVNRKKALRKTRFAGGHFFQGDGEMRRLKRGRGLPGPAEFCPIDADRLPRCPEIREMSERLWRARIAR